MVKEKEYKKAELPVKGLDVGTAFIYSAQKGGSEVAFRKERNAFFDIEHSDFTEEIFKKSNVKYALKENRLYIVGEDAIKFANLFGKNTRRPLRDGVISPKEEDAIPIIDLLIKSILRAPRSKEELIYYSVPGSPVDANFDIIYHQTIIKRFLENSGYRGKPINEGLAVILSELAKDNFTGIGISLGGGMANICFAVMATPVFSFSVARAGDWIDEQVARVTNETVSKITALKEANLNLNLAEISISSDKIDRAFYIYYNHLIEYILDQIKNEFGKHPNPKLDKPLPIIVSGGTVKPKGFLQLFKEGLQKIKLPFEIGEVKLASHPLFSVVKGALIAGIAERRRATHHLAT
jgi:hypothetical protein